MFDIGFLELLVIAGVLLLVIGPDRLPDVAKQIAFLIRKARQSMYRLRSEMQDEIQGTPFADLEAAKREIADLKNDLKQFGRDLAESAEAVKTEVEQQVSDVSEMVATDKRSASNQESEELPDQPKNKSNAQDSRTENESFTQPTKKA